MVVIESAERMRAEVERAAAALPALGVHDVVNTAVLHGNGNVIAVVEVGSDRDLDRAALAAATVAFCDGVGTTRVDGVLFFHPRHERGRRMVFFDRDGTWEAMCGNGLRCVTRYASDRGHLSGEGVIVTDDGEKAVIAGSGRVEVTVGRAREVRQLADDRWFTYTGVPHVVVFLDDILRLEAMDVRAEGALLRYDAGLCAEVGYPGGVHVDFAAADGDHLVVRTYEVGVEDETSCCGTGVVAAAHLAAHSGRGTLPTSVLTRGGLVDVGVRAGELTLAGEVGYLADLAAVDGVGRR